jgi:hypothetical protein
MKVVHYLRNFTTIFYFKILELKKIHFWSNQICTKFEKNSNNFNWPRAHLSAPFPLHTTRAGPHISALLLLCWAHWSGAQPPLLHTCAIHTACMRHPTVAWLRRSRAMAAEPPSSCHALEPPLASRCIIPPPSPSLSLSPTLVHWIHRAPVAFLLSLRQPSLPTAPN